MNKELAVRSGVNTVRETMIAQKETLFQALPRHLTPERMMRTICTALSRNPDLLKCTQESLFGCVVEASTLGLETDGVLGFGYLVPFKNNKAGTTDCTFIAGYKGLRELAYRSGKVAKLYMRIVRELDAFSYEYGLKETLQHIPRGDASDAWTHVYAVGKMIADDDPMFEVMTKSDVEAHRDKYAKGLKRSDSAWNTAPEEMAKKTVMRKLLKQMPLSSEIQTHVARDEQYEHGVFDGRPGASRARFADVTDQLPPAKDEPADASPQTDADDFERDVPPTQGSLLDGQEGEQP